MLSLKILRTSKSQRSLGKIALLLMGVSMLGTAQSPDLPAGPVQAKVKTACTECHDSRIIVQQRLGTNVWGKEVDKMVKWGAVVEPTDRDAFINYLSINFPPDKPAEPVKRTRAGKKR
jgi:hypothetical protein